MRASLECWLFTKQRYTLLNSQFKQITIQRITCTMYNHVSYGSPDLLPCTVLVVPMIPMGQSPFLAAALLAWMSHRQMISPLNLFFSDFVFLQAPRTFVHFISGLYA